MALRVGINGYGRIGRNVLRAFYESQRNHEIQIVAVNDLGDAATNAHLTQYDTAHGRFNQTVGVDGDSLVVNGDRMRASVPSAIPPSCHGPSWAWTWCWNAPACSPARPRPAHTPPRVAPRRS
jgi:glyceraldehyde 3-phosphate dehydrogenase